MARARPTEVDVDDVNEGASRVGADCERGERKRGRLARRGDEGAVDEDLDVVICGVELNGLVEEDLVFAVGVPAN